MADFTKNVRYGLTARINGVVTLDNLTTEPFPDIKEDPKLAPAEKETVIQWSNPDERFYIFSEQLGVIKKLLHHPEFSVEDRRAVDNHVVAVGGTLPLGTLKISADYRESSANGLVITKQVYR